MTFDPNKKFISKTYVWATYIPSRIPKFKIHSKKNHATCAVTYRKTDMNWAMCFTPKDEPIAILYEFIDGVWIERSRVERPVTV